MEVGRTGRLMRLRRMGRMPLMSPRLWWRRVVFWVGAVLVAAVAVGFTKAADWAGGVFLDLAAGHVWLPFIIAPAGLTIAFLLTRYVFPGAQGGPVRGDPMVRDAQLREANKEQSPLYVTLQSGQTPETGRLHVRISSMR